MTTHRYLDERPTEQGDDYARQAQLTTAYADGRQAFHDYVRYTENPHQDPDLADQWCNGWLVADTEAHG